MQCDTSSVNIQNNVSLKNFSTMRLGGIAANLTEVSARDELVEAYHWAKSKNLPVLVIGQGSNIVWKDEGFSGLVIVNKIQGFEIHNEDERVAYVTVGAGENWDQVVEKTVAKKLNGLAELSLIPGTAGATPVQNVGAYGQEISNVLVTLEAFDTQLDKLVNLTAGDCKFGYRTSRFKTSDQGRFFITAITLLLSKDDPTPPFYDALQRYLNDNNITAYNLSTIRQAVIAVRSAKLPDPTKIANNGSFFKNPIVDSNKLSQLLSYNQDLMYWHLDDGAKLSAAWLVEKAGFKNVHDAETGMSTWPTQSLVLVNEQASSTADLLAFKQKIVQAVQQKFDITLEQEPELLP